MGKEVLLSLDEKKPAHRISENLYGIFYEDINFSCDGGLNANMINNYSFDGVYFDKEEQRAVRDPLRYWQTNGGSLQSASENGLSAASAYGRIQVNGKMVLRNLGYNGGKENKKRAAISIKENHIYQFDAYVRNVSFDGICRIRVTDEKGKELTDVTEFPVDAWEWRRVEVQLHGIRTSYGSMEICLEGEGTVDLDVLRLFDRDCWGAEDPKWKYTKLRRDLVETLRDLHPGFLRFPGGCVSTGQRPGNEYDWKKTLGPLYDRPADYNLWAEYIEDGGYSQSFQIGFYEYFCLCEDLGASPLPVLFAGLYRQTVCGDSVPLDSAEFQEVVQAYLDLIAFANGDPKENEYALIRAKMGHPAPFGLKMIGIGNENRGEEYRERFAVIEKAVHDVDPEIVCIFSAGNMPFGENVEKTWAFARAQGYGENVYIDEHSYHSPEWFCEAAQRFDSYPRDTVKLYYGEYSANGMMARQFPTEEGSNRMKSALSEAAFLTGVERNSDLVVMCSYAPLFNLAGSRQWPQNLIDFNPSNVCRSVNYYVNLLFSTNVGTEYLPVEGSLPKDLYISATMDEDKVYLKVVNVGNVPYTMVLCSTDRIVREVERITLKSESDEEKNRIGFYGKAEEKIVPEYIRFYGREGRLSDVSMPYSVQVYRWKREKHI